MTGRSQPSAIVSTPEEPARPTPSAAQVTASGMGRTEGDAAEGSPEVVVLGEESTSVPLIPSVAGESVPAGTSWREGLAAIGAGGEPSLGLTSMGNDLPVRGEPLLGWASPEDPMSTLFTLDNTAETMERESLDMGIASMLEALDHARGALCDVVVPSSRVFA